MTVIKPQHATMTFADYQLLTPEQKQGEIFITDFPVPDITLVQYPKEYYYVDVGPSSNCHEDTYVYICQYCDSIYDVYHTNCKNCGAPLQMKPINRCC